MAFTNVWNISTPADTSLADQLGADIRQVRLDMQERMEQALVVSWSSDPISPQPQLLGNVVGKIQFYCGSSFTPSLVAGSSQGYAPQKTFVTATSGSVPQNVGPPTLLAPPVLCCNCVLPNNVVVTSFGFGVQSTTAGAIKAQLWQMNFQTNAVNQLGGDLQSDPSNGAIQIVQSTQGVANNFGRIMYSINVFSTLTNPNASFNLYYGFVTYNTPDCRSTV